ncbi:MAG TPA: DUF5683 domain-containing protein [Moheibacter sp.]|nr:DUF5683 domain-containing protein [Moheibacter sp.]
MKSWCFYIVVFFPLLVFSQTETQDSATIQSTEIVAVQNNPLDTIDYLSIKNPMRASLYSAMLPGMGQVYNKKYWKVPVVWALLGTGAGFVINYNNQYKEYRGYYLAKLYGNELDNPTLNNMDVRQLATIQDDRKRTRDYAIALTALAYILNIVDATVDAHLYGIDKDPDLSFHPTLIQNPHNMQFALALGVSYQF